MSDFDLEAVSALARDGLPGLIGIEWVEVRTGYAHGFVRLERKHFAPNGFVHAGTLVTLADRACGYGCMVSRPEGAVSFTTIELKTNSWAPRARAGSRARPGSSTAGAPPRSGTRR